MLRFAPEVRIGFFDERAGLVLHFASVWSLGEQIDVSVSAETGSTPGAGLLHPAGLAWDLDVITDTPDAVKRLARYLASRLPAGYDVALEYDHVHVEFDMRRKV